MDAAARSGVRSHRKPESQITMAAKRLGDNRYANSVIALKAATGKVVWQFQTVHHDLWDYDVATPPLLFEMHRNGKAIPAIAIGSKTGNVFILNRETGAPVFGVEERPVPKSDVPGEEAAATQPFPLMPRAVTPQGSSPDSAWGMDEADKKWCQDENQPTEDWPDIHTSFGTGDAPVTWQCWWYELGRLRL